MSSPENGLAPRPTRKFARHWKGFRDVPDPYLLDTNILVHFVRSDAIWRHIRATYSPLLVDPRPLISIVTVGELRSLANQFGWQAAKRSQMDFVSSYFRRISIDADRILDAYGMIDAHTQNIGQPMGKNDLWIA